MPKTLNFDDLKQFLLVISQELRIVGQKISTILVRLQKRAQNGAQRYQEKFFEEFGPH